MSPINLEATAILTEHLVPPSKFDVVSNPAGMITFHGYTIMQIKMQLFVFRVVRLLKMEKFACLL